MRVKPLPREEFWYFFRSLSFGVSDPGGHPELAVLGRQIAAALDGSFFGAKVLSSLLRTNLNAQFWGTVLGVVRRFVAELRGDEDHFSKLGVAKIALEILPVPLRLKSEVRRPEPPTLSCRESPSRNYCVQPQLCQERRCELCCGNLRAHLTIATLSSARR